MPSPFVQQNTERQFEATGVMTSCRLTRVAVPQAERLVTSILAGMKTSTTSTLIEYSIEDEALPQIGSRQSVIDSTCVIVATIETTAVAVARLIDVVWDHVQAEGEGYATVAEWRAGHEAFWHGEDMRNFLGDSSFTVTDDTQVVLERFRLVPDQQLSVD